MGRREASRMVAEWPRREQPRGLPLACSRGLFVLLAVLSAGARSAVQAATPEEQARMLRALRPDVQLKFTDDDLNAYFTEHRKELALPRGLQDPRVAFGEGFAEASARKKLAFVVPTRVSVKVRPKVRDGALVLEPIGGRAGKLFLPGMFRKKIVEGIGRFIEEHLAASGFELYEVEAHRGVLIVRGKLRPTAADREEERGRR